VSISVPMSTAPIRLYIHDPADGGSFNVTQAMWQEACQRNPKAGAVVHATMGTDDALFTQALGTADAVMTWTGQAHRLIVEPKAPLGPNLKLIQMTSAGLDRLAPFDWLPSGVHLCNNSGVHREKAGQWGIMAVLMLANAMPYFATRQREGAWSKRFTRTVTGRTLLLVGVGDMGTDTARHARHLGMRVIGVRARPEAHPHCDRVVVVDELDSVLPEADVVMLALPLTPASLGLFDRRRLSLMKPGAGLANMARGSVLDQDALADLLESGHLGGAILDVTVPEPLPEGHRLWSVPNLVIVPHVSSDDPDTYTPKTLDILLRNLAALAAGERPPTAIDPVRGY
jgi:glyoxylate/hydroxypyruvate reductase A